MNRRSFLTRLASGIAGGIITTHLPPSVLNLAPAGLQKECAIAYLTRVWNIFFRDRREAQGAFDIYVGESLYSAFVSEIRVLERFTSSEYPRQPRYGTYKTARLLPDGPGWHHRFVRRTDLNHS